MYEVLCNEELVGMYYLFLNEDLVYLSYICVREEDKGKSYGTKILQHIHEDYSDYRFVVDIEEVKENDDNYEEERRRRAFYLKNGYESTGVFYRIFGVDYELLSYNGKVSKEDWHALILNNWGRVAGRARYETR